MKKLRLGSTLLLATVSLLRCAIKDRGGDAALGEICSNGSSCDSGACVKATASMYGVCSKRCKLDADCKAGMACAEVAGEHYCAAQKGAGERCESDVECATHRCLPVSEKGMNYGVCAGRCALHSDCPDGTYCAPLESLGMACAVQKSTGQLCESAEECLSKDCFYPVTAPDAEARPTEHSVVTTEANELLLALRLCR